MKKAVNVSGAMDDREIALGVFVPPLKNTVLLAEARALRAA